MIGCNQSLGEDMRAWHFVIATIACLSLCNQALSEPVPISIPPIPTSHPSDTNINYGDVYGAVHFEIERFDAPTQPTWLKSLVEKVFGIASDGEYIVALELLDPSKLGDDQLVARKIIAHFIKKADGSVLTDLLKFVSSDPSGNKVQNASIIVFSGDLASRVPVNSLTNGYSLALQLYKANSSQLTSSDLVLAVNDVINSSASALNFAPLDAGIKTIYQQMRSFGFQLYKIFADSSTSVASVGKMSFIKRENEADVAPNGVKFIFPYNFDYPAKPNAEIGGKIYDNTITLTVKFITYASEIGNFKNGTFPKPRNWSQWLVQANIAGKGLTQTLLEASDTKPFLTALEGGYTATKTFLTGKGTDDEQMKATAVDACDGVLKKLASYYSSPDTGALYWAFLNQYWSSLGDKAGGACQRKYADIYFDSYGLPRIGEATAKAPALSATTLQTKSTKGAATLNEALARAQGEGSPAGILRAFQGIKIFRPQT
jgi:hypothetical protein